MSDAGQEGAGASVTLVVGANGGCGASLLAGALGLAAARTGEAAWLVELDLDRGDRSEAWAMPPGRTLADLLVVADELDERHLNQAAHAGSAGLHVLNASPAAGGAAAWTATTVVRLVGAARAAGGPAGRVVLDGGTGPSLQVRAAAGASDLVLVVCSPTVGAVRRARRLMDAISPIEGARATCAVVVASGPGARELGARAVARAVSAPVRAELPWSPGEASRLGCGQWPTGRRARLADAIASLSADSR